MKKGISLSIVTGMLFAVILTGCSGGGSETSTAPAASAPASGQAAFSQPSGADGTSSTDLSGKQVTVILKNLTDPFFINVKNGAEKAGKDFGIKVSVIAPIKAGSNEEQSQMCEQAISSQVDALVIAPADTNGIVSAVKKVKDAHIPLVDLNTIIGGSDVFWDTFVGADDYSAGKTAMTTLCKLAGGKGEAFIMEGVSGSQTSIDRVKGATDALKSFPDVKVVAQQAADYNRAKGMDVAQNLLQAHPNVKIFFCANDEMGLGAYEAVVGAGKASQILINGVGAEEDALKAVKNGTLTLTIDTGAVQQGYKSVEAAVNLIEGKTVEKKIGLPITAVTKDNVDSFLK